VPNPVLHAVPIPVARWMSNGELADLDRHARVDTDRYRLGRSKVVRKLAAWPQSLTRVPVAQGWLRFLMPIPAA